MQDICAYTYKYSVVSFINVLRKRLLNTKELEQYT